MFMRKGHIGIFMKPIVEIKDFTFTYPGHEKKVLDQVSLKIEEGSFTVLCGQSGCGKSSLLRQLKSVLAPAGEKSGQIFYCGKSLDEVDERRQSSEIGFVCQNPDNQIVTDKVWHELAFGLESLGYATEEIRLRVAEAASYFGIQNWFLEDVANLSGGQRQLLNLASIMTMHPKLVILDEPTSQLDPIAASDFLATVKKINQDTGMTVLLTEHRLQEVIPQADQLVVMDEGKLIAQGKPAEIGRLLKEKGHAMFLSMPVPMQIYGAIENDLVCPLTVSQGRKWINSLLGDATVQRIEIENKKKREEEKSEKKSFRKEKRKDTPAIEMQEVWYRYAKDAADVVRNLSLKVYPGEFYAIVGGNGTGKSTSLALLSRVRKPYRGKIFYMGKDIRKYSERELYRECIGSLPQNPQSIFLKKTVREDLYAMIGGSREKKSLDYQADMKKSQAVMGMARLCGLTHLLDRHPYDLSGGEQQKLALAKVLLLRPRILLMDEPTKGLDAEYKKELGDILLKLKGHGITILMVSHDVEFVAEYTDRTGLFFQGNIVAEEESRRFFAGNSFYTTAANRMARHIDPTAVTRKDVIECLKANL